MVDIPMEMLLDNLCKAKDSAMQLSCFLENCASNERDFCPTQEHKTKHAKRIKYIDNLSKELAHMIETLRKKGMQ